MPRVNWGVTAADVDDFDREKQYKPYDGPIPHNGVYQFRVKIAQFVSGSKEKLPQLRIGLELVPRASRKSEKQYAGYFIMEFAPVAHNTGFRYVPFLDAIGVSGRDFETRTLADEEGSIRKIGRWINDGKTLILAAIKDDVDQKGNPRKAIGWMGPVTDETDEVLDEEEAEEYDDEDTYDEEEEAPAPRRKTSRVSRTSRTRRTRREPEYDDEDDDEWE